MAASKVVALFLTCLAVCNGSTRTLNLVDTSIISTLPRQEVPLAAPSPDIVPSPETAAPSPEPAAPSPEAAAPSPEAVAPSPALSPRVSPIPKPPSPKPPRPQVPPPGYPGPNSIKSGYYRLKLLGGPKGSGCSDKQWMLAYTNKTCSTKTQPVLAAKNLRSPYQQWTISFWLHEGGTETDRIFLFNYNPGPGGIKCLGSLSATEPKKCNSDDVTIRGVDSGANFYQWRATRVKGLKNTYTLAATFRNSKCLQYLAVPGKCSTKPESIKLVAKDTTAARWVLERFYPSSGARSATPGDAANGLFVVEGVDGKPELITL